MQKLNNGNWLPELFYVLNGVNNLSLTPKKML